MAELDREQLIELVARIQQVAVGRGVVSGSTDTVGRAGGSVVQAAPQMAVSNTVRAVAVTAGSSARRLEITVTARPVGVMPLKLRKPGMEPPWPQTTVSHGTGCRAHAECRGGARARAPPTSTTALTSPRTESGYR